MLRKRKIDNEKRGFDEDWTIKYFFEKGPKGLPICIICSYDCTVNKEYNLRRHYQTQHSKRYDEFTGLFRDEAVKRLRTERIAQKSMFVAQKQISEACVRVSYRISEVIAERTRPFMEGQMIKDCLTIAAAEVAPEQQNLFSTISLTPNTVASRISEMGIDLTNQLQKKSESFKSFSLAFDGSTDVSDTEQLSVYIRGISSPFEIHEDIIGLFPMDGRTQGIDVKGTVKRIMEQRLPCLSWNLLSAIGTDGAPNMIGKEIGAVKLLLDEVVPPQHRCLSLHCIIHQESLCGKSLKYQNVMDVVVKVINFIRSKGLNHRQFRTLLKELDSQYGDILYHCEVRWLSRGRVLQRFNDLFTEIRIFIIEKDANLKTKNGEHVIEQMNNKNWLFDFACLSDITGHLNDLNIRLQGRGKFISQLWSHVRSFMEKLSLFISQAERNDFRHLPSVAKLLTDNPEEIFMTNKLKLNLKTLSQNFSERFYVFQEYEHEFHLFEDPFSINVADCEDSGVQLELIDLKYHEPLKSAFSTGDLIAFYQLMDEKAFPKLKSHAFYIGSMLGATDANEQSFSFMKAVKTSHRSRITNEHLDSVVRLALSPISPNIVDLVGSKRCQKSRQK
ncbi:General transcription factor II-I repeat domain-containing protein 2 [Oopsacas minuta]|uniref:General transcription factor II-I repeat domain-containing protein 2 n=1 Tax=Oopsacas minuta TaxID=111878 RepID=A0AAV7JIP5_9METZ|nr:General transcription factor II-I repeat domain-containing protein 2 [Oopsacas minuta]